MKASEEQQLIIDEMASGKNVIVEAVAGAGKSTAILFLCEALRNKSILQITYNSSLRLEIKEKVEKTDIQNLKVHTFHSLAVRYYLEEAFTDTELRRILIQKVERKDTLPRFDIVVLDEAQDMTKLYFQFIRKFIDDMCIDHPDHKIQLLILGDSMQGLYEFKGSDIRFLTHADRLWKSSPHLLTNEFVRCPLHTSYRITEHMASFVNHAMLGRNHLKACKEGLPVTYIRNSAHHAIQEIRAIIMQLLKEGHKPDDFFILAGSLKCVHELENVLVERHIPCYVPMFEKEKMDERVIKGKVVFSTFHSVKGRQRRFVFLYGFDNRYFTYYGRDLSPNVCPNTLYVGCTRATDRLFLFENDNYAEDRPLPFLKLTHKQMRKEPYIEFRGGAQPYGVEKTKKKDTFEIKHQTSVTDLVKFLPDDFMEEAISIIDDIFEKIDTNLEELDIPTIISTELGLHEDVSDLNGIAIPFYYNDKLRQNSQSSLYQCIEDYLLKDVKSGKLLFLKEKFREAPHNFQEIETYLYLSNLYSAMQEKFYYKLKQIGQNEYNWISQEMMDICLERMQTVVGSAEKMEEVLVGYHMEKELGLINAVLSKEFGSHELFYFGARVDMICPDVVWELKCTSRITIEHFLQVIIYAWIWRVVRPEDRKEFRIFNIKTGEIYRLVKSSLEVLTPIMVRLLKSKYAKEVRKTDDVFFGDVNSAYDSSRYGDDFRRASATP